MKLVAAVCHILLTCHISVAVRYEILPKPPSPPDLRYSNVSYRHVQLPHDLTVLAYNDIINPDEFYYDNVLRFIREDAADVTLQQFAEHMWYLAVNDYYTITATELYAYLTHNASLPPRSILLTFQETWLGVWQYAYPILKKHDFHATVFLSADNVGIPEGGSPESGPSGSSWSPDSRPRMTWDQLKVLDNEPLFDLYPSGKSGINLTDNRIASKRLLRELRDGRTRLESELGGTRPYFAWPHGAYNHTTVSYIKRFYNMSFALDLWDDPRQDPLRKVPRFVVTGHHDVGHLLHDLGGQQYDMSMFKNARTVRQCFDADLEVQGTILREAIDRMFVPCNDILFYPSRQVTSEQLAVLCMNVKRGIGLTDVVTYERTQGGPTTLSRAQVVLALYKCAKNAWPNFTNKLPELEIINPFSDVDGVAYGGVVVAMAGFCDVASPPNDRGDTFHPTDWSSRGNAVVAAWRMLTCLRRHIYPPAQYKDDFWDEAEVWQWSRDFLSHPPGSVAVTSSATPITSALLSLTLISFSILM